MSVLIAANINLVFGGWVGETAGGTKVIVASVSGGGGVIAYKDIDGTPVQIGSEQSLAAMFGGVSPEFYHVDAAIDSTDVIHVLAHGLGTTRVIAYNTISDPDGTPVWGTWAPVVVTYTEDQTAGTKLNTDGSISIDSNDKPECLITDIYRLKGSNYSVVLATDKTGASWSTPVAVGDNAQTNYAQRNLSMKASDNVEAAFKDLTALYFCYNTRTSGSWDGIQEIPETGSLKAARTTITSGGTVYRYHTAFSTAQIQENDVSTGFAGQTTQINRPSAVLDGTDRYVFYIDGDNDVVCIENTGSGWSKNDDLQVGSYDRVISAWQYNNHNNVDTVDYVFDNSGVYWDEYALTPDTEDNLDAVGITADPVLGTPTLGQIHILTATGITADPVLGTPTVTEIVDLTATGITTTPVLDTPTATHIHDLTAVDITADPVLGTPTVTDVPNVDDLDAVGITTTPVLDAPALAQVHALVSVGITADPVLGTPTIGQTHVLVSVGITADPVLGTPALAQVNALTAVDITTTPVLGTPTATHIHVLTAVDITADPVLDTPTIGQIHVLTSVGITTSPVLGIPTASEIDVLVSVGITVSPVLGIPTATHIHVLTAVGITVSPVLGIPTAAHIHVLTSVGITADPVLDTSTIGQIHALVSVDISTTPVLGIPSVGIVGPGLSIPTFLDTVSANNNMTSMTSGTISPTANALLVVVLGYLDAQEAIASIVDTLTGTGTWNWVEEQHSGGGNGYPGIMIGWAKAGPSPGSGTITVSYTPGAGRNNRLIVYEVTGQDTTTPVPQSNTNEGAGTSLVVTLASAPDGTSMVFGAITSKEDVVGGNVLPGSGFTELDEYEHSAPAGESLIQTQYDLVSADTTTDWTNLENTENDVGAAIEIAEAVGAEDNLVAVGITVNPALDTPTIGQTHVLTSVGITVNPALDTPTIGQTHVLTSVGTTTTPVLGTPTVTETTNLTAVGITVNSVLDTPALAQVHALISVDITASPVLDTTTIGQIHVLISVDITVNPALDIPTIGQIHVLTSVGITVEPVLGTPVLSSEGEDNLVANGITADPVLGTPAIGQTHALSSVGISITPVTGVPTLTIVHILDATGIITTPVVEESAIGQTHALSSTEIYTTPVTGTPILSHIHVLNAIAITVTPIVEVPSIGQIHPLDATTIVVSPILGVPLSGQTHILDATGITTTPELGVASFELVDGIAFIIFSAYQPEMDFDAYQPEIDFNGYQPEVSFTISVED